MFCGEIDVLSYLSPTQWWRYSSSRRTFLVSTAFEPNRISISTCRWQVLVYGNKILNSIGTYTHQEWSLEETLLRIVGVISVIFVQESRHIHPPDMEDAIIKCVPHAENVVRRWSYKMFDSRIRVLIPIEEMLSRDEKTTDLRVVQPTQWLILDLCVDFDGISPSPKVDDHVLLYSPDRFRAGHTAASLDLHNISISQWIVGYMRTTYGIRNLVEVFFSVDIASDRQDLPQFGDKA